jgi:hypothetical protein
MFGSIIPEPLATHVIVASLPATLAESAFGYVSVVMIPSAPTSGSSCRSAAMPRSPRSIFSIGSGTPITPVELTSTRSAVVRSSAAAAAAMRRAFSTPAAPVATLLTLLFTTTPRSTPPRIVSRPRTTGAPGKWLRVKTAAAAASTSLAKSARSLAVGLSPQLRLAQAKPRGKRGRS